MFTYTYKTPARINMCESVTLPPGKIRPRSPPKPPSSSLRSRLRQPRHNVHRFPALPVILMFTYTYKTPARINMCESVTLPPGKIRPRSPPKPPSSSLRSRLRQPRHNVHRFPALPVILMFTYTYKTPARINMCESVTLPPGKIRPRSPPKPPSSSLRSRLRQPRHNVHRFPALPVIRQT